MFNNVLKKIFGKKNDGFYLQLEDEDASSKPEAKAQAKPDATLAPPAVVTTSNAPVAVTIAPTPVAITAPATATKAEQKAAKIDKKAAKKAEAAKVVPAPAPTLPAAPPITNFATDYLIKPSSNSGRRRPGANMKGFLDLARQVEKPKEFKATASERKPSADAKT
ncbi:hypothetical protein [Chamaesiphon sp.]|uniref:hypothetical protein n=1 Tax=Chamaesiphon sp. TaxID=2814140 RepID=UPI003593CBC7